MVRPLSDARENRVDDGLLANLNQVHTTELGEMRIKRNLELDAEDIVAWCRERIKLSNCIIRKGKNWYISDDSITITVNAHSFTIITAHRNRSCARR